MGHDLSDAAVTGDVKAPEIQSPPPQLDEYNNRQEDNKKIHKKGRPLPETRNHHFLSSAKRRRITTPTERENHHHHNKEATV